MTGLLTLGLALLVIGLLLMLGDLLLPTGGVLAVVGIGIVIVGVVMMFIYDNIVGLWTLLGVFVAIPIIGGVLVRLWPHTPMGKRLMLTPPETEEATSLPLHKEMEEYRGRIGQAASSLRPSGIVDFDGRRVDCITEGMMVDPGQWVRCVTVQGGKVVVRLIDKPDLTTLENTDFT